MATVFSAYDRFAANIQKGSEELQSSTLFVPTVGRWISPAVRMPSLAEPLLTTRATSEHDGRRYTPVVLSLAACGVFACGAGFALRPGTMPSSQINAAVVKGQWYDGIDSIRVLRPGDDVEKMAWKLYNEETGCDSTGEFSPRRHAFLLTPGTYRDDITVGYYTSLLGVGESVEDVRIRSFRTHNRNCVADVKLKCCDGGCSDGLTNFWRSVEGVTTLGNSTWAASQAAPLRRLRVGGQLSLSEHAPVSGGFIADSVVEGELIMGLQQQHLIRNSELRSGAMGTYMNYVFLGVDGAPPPAENGRVSVLEATPRVAAKPYLVEENGAWSIVVPERVQDTRGPSQNAFVARVRRTRIAMEDVYVAREGDDAESINAAIEGKRALLLTPAIYTLTAPITIKANGFVVLGIGFATLLTSSGQSALVIEADAVRVAGVLLESGTSVSAPPTAPLLRWVGHLGVGSDVFTRVGAFAYAIAAKESCLPTRADVHVAVDGDDLILDNTWLWHADHDDCRSLSEHSFSRHGLVVTGARTTALGLQVEHQMEDLVVWRGEGGEVYMFQSELPYSYANFTAVGYRVEASVRLHTVVGGGVYGIGKLYPIPVGIRLSATTTAKNLFVWAIAAAPKFLPDHSRFGNVLCTGKGDAERCYAGNCDFVACFVPHL